MSELEYYKFENGAVVRVKKCWHCHKSLPGDNQNKFELDDGSTVDVCIECAIWLAHNAPEKEYFYSLR